MSNELKIKSNGLRNELKEIRKSIDKLTNAILMAQTNKRYERNNYTWDGVCGDDCECTPIKQNDICRDETGRSFGI